MNNKKTAKSKNSKPLISASAQREAEIAARKEAHIKLRGFSPLARAEVVNEVVEKAVARQFVGFIDFLREQSVVGLAVGLVLGTQVKQLVDSLINNLVLPIIGLVLPGKETLDKKTLFISFAGKVAELKWGAVVVTVISFTAVVAIVYMVFKGLKLDKLAKKKEPKEDKPKKKKK